MTSLMTKVGETKVKAETMTKKVKKSQLVIGVKVGIIQNLLIKRVILVEGKQCRKMPKLDTSRKLRTKSEE